MLAPPPTGKQLRLPERVSRTVKIGLVVAIVSSLSPLDVIRLSQVSHSLATLARHMPYKTFQCSHQTGSGLFADFSGLSSHQDD